MGGVEEEGDGQEVEGCVGTGGCCVVKGDLVGGEGGEERRDEQKVVSYLWWYAAVASLQPSVLRPALPPPVLTFTVTVLLISSVQYTMPLSAAFS